MAYDKQIQTEECRISSVRNPITLRGLFLIWLRIGCTSFGGGAITQYLIQENFIYKRHLITAEEYANIIAMCQISPGINIIGYTILIGKRIAGRAGIIVSLLGLILPSAAITVGISAAYATFSEYSRVQSALRAMFAAIFGIAIATNYRNARPIFVNSSQRGLLTLGTTIGILIGSGLIYVLFHPSVIVLYLLGGFGGAGAYWYASDKKRGKQ